MLKADILSQETSVYTLQVNFGQGDLNSSRHKNQNSNTLLKLYMDVLTNAVEGARIKVD
jgi:hypothetical protein